MKIVYAIVLTLIIAGGSGFYGGLKYQQSKTPQLPSFMQGMAGGNGTFRMVRNGQGGNGTAKGNSFVNGQILSKDAKSITVKTQEGGSKIVFITDTTQIQKTETGKSTDLANEKYVVITGNSNSDGSITAANIQLRDTPPPQMNSSTQPIPPAEAPKQ